MFTLMINNTEFPNQTFILKDDPIDNSVQQNSILQKHGSDISPVYMKSRRINIKGIIHSGDTLTSRTQFDSLKALLQADSLVFQHESDRRIICVSSNIKPKYKDGTDKAWIDINMQLIAENPFYESVNSNTSINTCTGLTTTFNVSNSGNAFAEPLFAFFNSADAITDNITLSNTTTDRNFSFRGVLAAGQTLLIDSSDFSVLNNGVDGLSNFEGSFLLMESGVNVFQFVGETDTVVTITYRDRWY